ncbi:hypothetical protein GOEFS_132_00350 [Gordonia effusa NBRC 100432]|uniref:Lipoprotein LprB n=1 Tax=Gordonia effusa NBRC 100432 TaxID=1077974 RepID=H0R6V3_9ACTN|nr:DUF3558 family protein [Gordonia effusa]GAB20804.1 hypothetical protein GOEFS_132_00350 [Gordonia effusa NBRC 100432]
MRSGVASVAALFAVLVLTTACANDDSADDSETPAATPTVTGPSFRACGGIELNEVATQTGFSGLRLVAETTAECQWVAGSSARVSFNWYRGSPLDRERGGVELTKDDIQDITISGHSGFIASAGTVCETGIGFDADFIEWSARMDEEGVNNVGIDKVCQAVRELARMSIERAK